MKNTNPDHYYVVVATWDDVAKRYVFRIDDDTLIARFPDGSVWDGSEWCEPVPADEDPTDWNLSLKLSEALYAYNYWEANR